MKIEKKVTPIAITESAAKELKQLFSATENNEGLKLRLGVKSGGCSGYSYIIGFDEVQDGDEEYEINGLNVVIQQAHLQYLNGITLDYENGLNNRGFVFDNPNADETCGCGSSFSA